MDRSLCVAAYIMGIRDLIEVIWGSFGDWDGIVFEIATGFSVGGNINTGGAAGEHEPGWPLESHAPMSCAQNPWKQATSRQGQRTSFLHSNGFESIVALKKAMQIIQYAG